MNGKNEFNIIDCFDCQSQRGRDTSSQTIMFSGISAMKELILEISIDF